MFLEKFTISNVAIIPRNLGIWQVLIHHDKKCVSSGRGFDTSDCSVNHILGEQEGGQVGESFDQYISWLIILFINL